MPESIVGSYNYDVVSSWEVHKPEKLTKLFSAHGSQGQPFFMVLFALGWEESVAQDTYSHFEDYWKHETFKVKEEVAAPGAGNAAVITLHTDSVDDNNRFYAREWDLALFTNEVTGSITDIDVSTPGAPVITVYPSDSTDDIGLLEAGSTVVLYSNAHSEGSDQPDGRATGVIEYENYTQIIKEKVSITGSELTRQEWILVQDPAGANRPPLLWHKALLDVDYRQGLAISGALLVGKRTTNTNIVDIATGFSPNTTVGLIPTMRQRGLVLPKAQASFALSDMHTIAKHIRKNYSSDMVFAGLGIDRMNSIETLLRSEMQNTNINYTRERSDNAFFRNKDGTVKKGMGLDLGFKYVIYDDITFHLKLMEEFHHPKVLGATGYPYEDMGLFIPMMKTRDKKSGKPLGSLGYKYKKLGDYSRRMEMWNDGAAGPGVKIGGLDKRDTNLRSEIGGQFVCLDGSILLTES